jgi:hypothetical protein
MCCTPAREDLDLAFDGNRESDLKYRVAGFDGAGYTRIDIQDIESLVHHLVNAGTEGIRFFICHQRYLYLVIIRGLA